MLGGHIGDVWAAVHAALSLPSLKATINLEYYRFNYQVSNEINFSGLISVLNTEVGLLRM
jgi:hypothetical protein